MPPQQAPPNGDQPASSVYGAKRVSPLTLPSVTPPAPDRAARIVELRYKTGLAPALIERNFDELDRQDRGDGIDIETMRRIHPALAAYLEADPTRAAAAADDIPTLQNLERNFKAADPLLRGIDMLQGTAYGFVEWAGEASGARTLTEFGREGRERNRAEAAFYGQGPTWEQALESPSNMLAWAYNAFGEQLPQMAPSLAGGAAGAAYGSTFGPAGTVIGGLIGAFATSEVMGIGETQGNLKDLDPTATAPLAVFVGGTAIAALDAALPGKVGAKLVRSLGRETAEQVGRRVLAATVKPRHLVKTARGVVTGMATEGLTEALQEAIGAVAAAEGAGQSVDWEQVKRAAIEAGAAGALMGGVFEGGSSAIESRRQAARAIVAEQQQAFFSALGGNLKDSKLLERQPAAVREFIAGATKDGPLETVYVPADTFEEYFQRIGENPTLVAEALTGNPRALEQAKQDQGDKALLPIPIAEYATRIAATEHQSFFQRELKLRPNLDNLRELQERIEREVQHTAVRGEAAAQSEAAHAEIARRFTELAIERGAPHFQAEPWGRYLASRYVERARRKGVDPLALYEQQPRDLVIQEASGASLMPQPVQGEAHGGIPPSVATPGETPAARSTRLRAHVAALASTLVRDAQRLDPTVDPAQIRAELEFRMAFADEQLRATAEAGTGQELLRAIAGYGGLWWDDKSRHFKGEIEDLIESGRDIKGVKAGSGRVVHQAGRATYNGVAGVFREGGLPADGMVEALRQEQRFAYIEDVNDLVDAVDRALRAKPDVDEFAGSEQLEALGIRPGAKWWSDTWRGLEDEASSDTAPAEDVLGDQALEQELGDDVDVSFDPDEFEQLRPIEAELQRAVPLPDRVSVVALEGTIDTIDPQQLRSQAFAHAKAGEPRPIRNAHTAWSVTVSKGGLKKSANHATRPEQLLALTHVDTLIREAVFLREAPDRTRRGVIWDYLYTPFTWNGESYIAKLALERQGQGRDTRREFYTVHAVRVGTRPESKPNIDQPGADALPSTGGSTISTPDLLARVNEARQTSAFFQIADETLTPAARLEALPRVEGRGIPEGARHVPFPFIADQDAELMFAAAGGLDAVSHTELVPLTSLIATQRTFTPDVARTYLEGAPAAPLAMRYRGQFYLADGTHRAIAAWAKGEPALEVSVIDVDDARLEALRTALAVDDSGRALLGPGGSVGPVAAGATAPPTTGESRIPSPSGARLDTDHAVEAFRRAREAAREQAAAAAAAGEEFYQRSDGVPSLLARVTKDEASRARARAQKARDARTAARRTHARRRQGGEFFQRLREPAPAPPRQIDTPAFTAWFDHSVVTEADGEPRVVYHGTMDADFDEFRTPAFFATDPYYAAAYSMADADPRLEIRSAVMPVYLSIQHPLDLRALSTSRNFTPEQFTEELRARGVELTPEMAEAMHGGAKQARSWYYVRRLSERFDDLGDRRDFGAVERLGLATVLRAAGYDGVVQRESIEHEPGRWRESTAYVVFDPAQIKSAIGNRGTYDAGDPSIVREALPSTPATPDEFDRVTAEIDEALERAVEAEGGRGTGIAVDAHLDDRGDIYLDLVMVPFERQGQGVGSRVVKALLDYADRQNLRVSLDPSPAKGKKAALARFYSRLGFTPEPTQTATGRLVRPSIAERRPTVTRYRQAQPFIRAAALATRTELVTVGSRQLGADSVRTAHDAAAALQYLARGAQERFDALVTDADGNPLAIVGAFKGKVDQTVVFPQVVLAEALRVDGAARIWFAHNHPSGAANLSTDDRLLNAQLVRQFTDTGIEAMGMLAIGSGELGAQVFQFQGRDARLEDGIVRYDHVVRGGTGPAVPIVEREFAATAKLDEQRVHTPALAMKIGAAQLGAEFGVVFLDTQLRPIGKLALDATTVKELRAKGRLRELLTAASIGNPSAAIIWTPQTDAQRSAAYNLANALKFNSVDVLDIASPVGVVGNDRLKEELTSEFFQPDEPGGGIRGAFNPRTGRIRMIAGAQDLSTFLHESGHAFLDELMQDALDVNLDDPNTTELQRGLVRDATSALRWFGFAGSFADFQALTVDERRPFHETWANGFEAYLMTGKAPSEELRPLFATFRSWLLAAYKLIRRGHVDRATAEAVKGVTLSEEIRGVMDRLLASDEAIAAARAESQVDALFSDAATAGVDALTWAAYQQQLVDANRAAREDLDRRLLEDWRRERQAWWHNERDSVRSEIEREAAQNPVFVALSVMRTGKLPDGSIPSFGDGRPLKLSKADVVKTRGKDFLKRLPKPYLYAVEGGLPADTLAELLGFSSGDALLDSLVGAKPMRPLVEAEADRVMRERHGDLLLEGMQLGELAEQAIHENRGEVISAELKALTKGMANASIPSGHVLRQAAVARIAAMPVRELRPGLFLQASTRASQQAFDAFARNDRAAAVRFKTQELTSLALYRAAAEAKDRAFKSAQLLQAFQVSKGRRTQLLHAGQDYLDQVDALLERFEFTKSSQVQLDRRTSLRTFVEQQEQKGLPVAMPEWLIDDAKRINYTQLTVEELEGVRAAVEQIAHVARLKDKLLKARDARELGEILAEIAGSIRAHHATRGRNLEPRLAAERAKKFVAGVSMSHRKIASLARELDGFVDGGPMFEHVIRLVNDAGNSEASMNAAAGVTLRGLFRTAYSGSELAQMGRKRVVREISTAEDPTPSLSKQALLMLALNQGNETNRQRLRDGYGWTQEQVQQALDAHLDRRDWEFVQGVWDYIDTFWPAIVDKQQRVIGAPPVKVLATPVFTRHGEFRGGYFPIKFERELSGRIANLEDAAAADMQKAAAYVHATTARGHLERRVEGNVREHPVRLDFGVIWEHVGQVIHDLTHHEMLIDVGRMLGSKEVESAIRETLGIEAFDQFRSALKDIAIGDAPAKHEGEGILRYIRNGATVVGLGWNGMTSALQLLGFNQSIKRVGPVWVAKGLGSFLRGAVAMDGTVKAVMAESELMRNRISTQSPEVASLRRELGIDVGLVTGSIDAMLRKVSADHVTRTAIADSFLFFITRAQLLVDFPTYLGAKAKAMADPQFLTAHGTIDEARCIAIAEQAVLDAQGGGQIKDLASIQRGSSAWKIWTNFYSFFNTTYNLWAESVRAEGKRAIAGNPIAIGRLAVDFLILFTAPTVLNHLVRSALTGSLLDELEEPDELIKQLALENVAYLMGTMVILRELGGVIQGYSGYDGPAGARGVAVAAKFAKQAMQGELDASFWRTFNQLAGVAFHYPAGQVDRTVRGIAALMDGTTENPAAVVFGPPRD